ncbi:hypothetical protein [Gimesia sp.]|uniref:hypothetical protein n=1 Tax=Gimesia sp. TaxID=2024833 RepID=UPI003A939EF7
MPPFDIYLYGFGLLISIVIWPFMVVAVVGFQAINPFTDPVWKRPTHSSNPFRLRNPLYPAHFLMCFMMAQGAGILATSLIGGWLQLLMGIATITGSLTGLWGLELVMKMFPKRMAPEDSVD